MPKQISSKKIMIFLGTAVIIIVAVIVFFISNSKNSMEAFRSIMIYDLQGNALIERADIGTIDARENLYLESGDRVLVSEAGMMRLKLDNDKYITAEADTIFTLEAAGNDQDSKTRIYLEKGEIINEIQNPLSSESIYETVTPNAVMAVRGTVFGVELYDNGEGGLNTRLCCFDGVVGTMPIFPDGTSGEEVMVAAGSEITVYEDGAISEPNEIDYAMLSEQALETLSALNIGINIDMAQGRTIDDTNQSKVNTTADDALQQDENIDKDSDDKKNDNKQTAIAEKDDIGSKADGNKIKESKEQQKSENNTSDSGSGSNAYDSGNSRSDGENSNSDDGNSSDSENSNSGGDSGSGGSGHKPGKPSIKVNYTVTFKYNGTIFATQTVPKGDNAKEPVLIPASTGKWNFDFDTPIKEDTVIEWTHQN